MRTIIPFVEPPGTITPRKSSVVGVFAKIGKLENRMLRALGRTEHACPLFTAAVLTVVEPIFRFGAPPAARAHPVPVLVIGSTKTVAATVEIRTILSKYSDLAPPFALMIDMALFAAGLLTLGENVNDCDRPSLIVCNCVRELTLCGELLMN
jgi:hypothetical protein